MLALRPAGPYRVGFPGFHGQGSGRQTWSGVLETIELYQELSGLTRAGAWTWDLGDDAIAVSPELRRILEVPPEVSVSASDMPGFRSSASGGVEADALREALRSGRSWNLDHPATTRTGRDIWVRSVGRVERVGGRTVRICGVVQDVTDEHNARVELEQNRLLLEEISALSGIGGWEYDAASNRVHWSAQTRRIFEADASFEPTPEALTATFGPGGIEIQDSSVQHAMAFGVPSDCEYDAVTLKGRPIRVRSVCRVEQHDGQIRRLVGTIQDITRQRNLERTLGRTERLLEDISSLTGVGGWEVDLTSGRVLWTSQLQRIFEADASFEPTTEAMTLVMKPAAKAQVDAALRDAVKQGGSFDIEFDAVTLRGREMRVRSIGHAECENGRTLRVVGTLEDVTLRHIAEADRRRTEALHEQVSRLAGIGGWEFDITTTETVWSPQLRKIFEVDDSYNPRLEDHAKFVAPEFADAVARARRQAVVEGQQAAIEFQGITAKGRRIWLRNIYQAERVDGRAIRLFGTAQDITAARAAQAELDLLHTRLKDAIEAAELRVWEIDAETGELRWDPKLPPGFVEPGMGATLVSTAALGFLHPDDRDAFVRQTEQATRHDQASVSRIRICAPGGGLRHVEMRMRASSTSADRRVILGVSRDVTRDVMLSEELVRKRLEAEEASLAKSQFVARMSHEIRTPMSGVIGMLDVLLRTEVEPNKRAHTATALKSARDLMSVLDDIIDVSQLESRRLALDREPFSIVAVVEDVAALFTTLAREKAVALTSRISGALPEWVMGDPRRVRQVLTNLVGNAVKFTEHGKVEIRVSYDAGSEIARFAVEDTGVGIPGDAVGRIFDLFFQADGSSTRRHGGSGLGLAISKQLVGMMGGEIGVDSEPAVGSTFRFTIAAPATIRPAREIEDAEDESLPHLRILVAEDNPAMQQILRAVLEAGGHELSVVADGRDAVAMAASGTFDVILMDVMMPIMDGPTATQRIRELGGRAGGIPIIALTANALAGDRDRYLEIGMTDYLSKPIDVAALFGVLRKVTGKV